MLSPVRPAEGHPLTESGHVESCSQCPLAYANLIPHSMPFCRTSTCQWNAEAQLDDWHCAGEAVVGYCHCPGPLAVSFTLHLPQLQTLQKIEALGQAKSQSTLRLWQVFQFEACVNNNMQYWPGTLGEQSNLVCRTDVHHLNLQSPSTDLQHF